VSITPLTYERKPPVGNSLIDDESGAVFIRLLPDRKLGSALSWVFVVCGFLVLVFAVGQIVVTPITVLQSVPILFAGVLFFVLAATMRYTPRQSSTTIHATRQRIEYTANGFEPRIVERSSIRRVFTRNAPLSKRLYIGLQFTDGGEMVLGCGEAKEIEAMARALHRVLNSSGGKEDSNG